MKETDGNVCVSLEERLLEKRLVITNTLTQYFYATVVQSEQR